MKTPDSANPFNRSEAYLRFLNQFPHEPIRSEYATKPLIFSVKKVLLTGAAGSIGGELAAQICAGEPALLAILDQSETALYELETALSAQFPLLQILSFIADITDEYRMEAIVARVMPDVIFHAAAYKHVAVMEKHPYEALKVNFFGTKILADLAVKYTVSSLLFVSTDKAVRPASAMGVTKRLAELYIQHICHNSFSNTKFITTRFGNVLGSSGSFSNILQNQIEKGGPVTITHPFATRYFMTASEACQLVIHAFLTGENGDIMFFDMGDRIPIVSIADQMILAYGLVPDQDIAISYIGLRPGEKLHEDLLNDNETVKPGACSKTRIAVSDPVPAGAFKEIILLLEDTMYRCDDHEITAMLKRILPYLCGQRADWTSLKNQLISCTS